MVEGQGVTVAGAEGYYFVEGQLLSPQWGQASIPGAVPAQKRSAEYLTAPED